MMAEGAGAIWRRWDPHVHFPGTLHNDGFAGMNMEAALEVLTVRSPTIEAVGVTDYFTTRSFRRARQAWNGGAGSSIRFLFPNVELRLSHATKREAAINLHLLCAPEHVDDLDRFLGGLEFRFGERTYRGDEPGLQALGRAFSNDASLDDSAALRKGAMQFKIDFEALRSAYERDGWAKENLLVAVAGGGYDGTSGLQAPDDAFTALRRSIERFAHIVFSGDPKQAEFWSGLGADDEATLLEKFGGKKVCLHGSDAHSPERLGTPEMDRFCWLNGDPGFETLRMACLAPETRAHIGAADPMDGYRLGRIAHVSVPGKAWFPAKGVPINPGLVAIIGARGSGKTALADVIAAGAGSADPFANNQSFVHRAAPLLRGSTSEVAWTHDETTRRSLSDPGAADPTQPRGVRYLSQQFVEQLCAADGVSDSLLAEIERVVFASYPAGRRQGATTFNELLDIRLQASRGRQHDEIDAIADLGERITVERILSRSIPTRGEELSRERATLALLDSQVRELTSRGEQGNADRLATITAALRTRVAQLQAIERRMTELRSLRERVDSIRTTTFPRFLETLKGEHPRAGITDEDWVAFAPAFSGPVNEIITRVLARAEHDRGAVAGVPQQNPGAGEGGDVPTLDGLDTDALDRQSVTVLEAEQRRLQGLIGLDKQRAASLEKLNRQASGLRTKIDKLAAELAHAETAGERAASLSEERLAHYAAYFDALLHEETELRELYQPLESMLSDFGATAAKLKLSVRRRVDVSRWAAQGEQLIDLRAGGRFRGIGEMRRIAEEELEPVWETGDGAEAAGAIREFSRNYSHDIRDQPKARTGDPADYREWERSVNRWLYSAEHISLSYTLMYDKLSIERLSPGSRGIVLLLLYLAVDRTESDPLIIDQPEENLDPESVYSELVKLFRDASRRRQIIMVTHNANLVVNTDVDQVIVAHCDSFEEGKLPDLRYLTGGLEDPAVRKQVCEVLEGGAEAFRQRARRLRLSV